MAIKDMSLEDLIRSGKTIEEIKKDFDTRLADAASRVEKEKAAAKEKAKKNILITKTREKMIRAMLDYLVALGTIEDYNDADVEVLSKGIKETEGGFTTKEKDDEEYADEALRRFLERLF
jgi:predicted nucleotide-binding protein